MLQTQRYCKECERKTLFQKNHFSGAAGLFLSIITVGLFIPIWLLIGLCETLTPYRCSQCGRAKH